MKLKIIIATFFLINFASFSQVDNDFKDAFLEAQSYFHFEEYEEALPILSQLLRNYPNNNNLKYLIGRCLLHDPYRTEQAIRYLTEAVKHISPKYKFESYKEIMTPLDSRFYLGEAYHKSNMIDKALEEYNKFLLNIDENIYDRGLVEKRIESCKYALKSMETPVPFSPVSLGEVFNSNFEEYAPVISGDGKTIAFTRKLQFYDGIFISYKTETGWTNPYNLIPDLGVDGKIVTSSLNFKGDVLYLYNLDDYDGNIYISIKENNQWSNITRLNDYINTKYWESNAFESKDGEILYFASNRPGGQGQLDLYMSYRTSGLNWGPAINLGPTINSIYNDDAPSLIMDGNVLLFSSYGNTTIGDYDYFYSILKNNNWSKPVNLGYPINTTGEEILLSVTENGDKAILSLYNEETFGLKDIYYFNPKTILPELDILEETITKNKEKKTERDTFSISVNNLDKKKESKTENVPDEKIERTDVSVDIQSDTIVEPEEKFEDQVLTKTIILESMKHIKISSGEEIIVPVNTENSSELSIKIYNNQILIYEEKFDIQEDKFLFKHTPVTGENKIEFILTYKNGESKRDTIIVESTPSETLTQELTVKNEVSQGEILNMKKILEFVNQYTQNEQLNQSIRQIKTDSIMTLQECVTYLFENINNDSDTILSEKAQYSERDLIESIINATGLNNAEINEFYKILFNNATEPIKEFITGLKINEEGYSPVSLIEKIFEAEPYESFTKEDIYETLTNLLTEYGSEDLVYKRPEIITESKGLKFLYIGLIVISLLILLIIFKKRKQNK